MGGGRAPPDLPSRRGTGFELAPRGLAVTLMACPPMVIAVLWLSLGELRRALDAVGGQGTAGGHEHFNQIRRGPHRASPGVLRQRLRRLRQVGVVEGRLNPGTGSGDRLTEAGVALGEVVMGLGVWGALVGAETVAAEYAIALTRHPSRGCPCGLRASSPRAREAWVLPRLCASRRLQLSLRAGSPPSQLGGVPRASTSPG